MASSFRLLAGLRIGVPGRSDREHRPHRFPRKERKRMTGLSVPKLGRRGGGWVVLQSILFVAIAACGFVGVYWPGSVESYLAVIGFVLIVSGIVLVVTGALTLGRSFTHLPRPRRSGRLHASGIYRLRRHPLYRAGHLPAPGLALGRGP